MLCVIEKSCNDSERQKKSHGSKEGKQEKERQRIDLRGPSYTLKDGDSSNYKHSPVRGSRLGKSSRLRLIPVVRKEAKGNYGDTGERENT